MRVSRWAFALDARKCAPIEIGGAIAEMSKSFLFALAETNESHVDRQNRRQNR